MASTVTPAVRSADPNESEALAATLGAAFQDDPVMRWWIDDDAERARVSPAFFRFSLEHLYLRFDQTYVADDVAGVAAWCPPGRWRADDDELAELLPGYLAAVGEQHFERGAVIVYTIEEAHPEEPHWYLPVIGVRPEHQGRGLGSALLSTMTSKLDTEGLPAYLEASTERNRALYQRHGFEVTGELHLPEDGPTLWQMWRDPKGSA